MPATEKASVTRLTPRAGFPELTPELIEAVRAETNALRMRAEVEAAYQGQDIEIAEIVQTMQQARATAEIAAKRETLAKVRKEDPEPFALERAVQEEKLKELEALHGDLVKSQIGRNKALAELGVEVAEARKRAQRARSDWQSKSLKAYEQGKAGKVVEHVRQDVLMRWVLGQTYNPGHPYWWADLYGRALGPDIARQYENLKAELDRYIQEVADSDD